jgi:hypothetical protein
VRERERNRREGVEVLHCTVIGGDHLQHYGAPVRKPSSLATYWVGEKEGDGREESGL